ncbi:hypothetical protein ACI3QN_12270, partial [Propionibacterium freudenreichii]|uniref:hypothetical protein n=1 Tax=Propionibacterium freudenreichii TaxID=1744 RepID=UPI0038520DA7
QVTEAHVLAEGIGADQPHFKPPYFDDHVVPPTVDIRCSLCKTLEDVDARVYTYGSTFPLD